MLGFLCHTQRIERDKFVSTSLIEDRVAQHDEGRLSGAAVALDALADIEMLADADMFVMLLRSCFARVAYALAMARQGRPPPIISLEAPWSPYKGMKKKLMVMGGLRGAWSRTGRGRSGALGMAVRGPPP